MASVGFALEWFCYFCDEESFGVVVLRPDAQRVCDARVVGVAFEGEDGCAAVDVEVDGGEDGFGACLEEVVDDGFVFFGFE